MPAGAGDEIHAYFVRPAVEEPVPGIVAVHHLPGWDEFYREFAERLARHGYSVICPDLYCSFGHGTPDDVAARSAGGVPDDIVADCAAALAWLKAQPSGSGKAGIIDTCSGGRHARLAASRVPRFRRGRRPVGRGSGRGPGGTVAGPPGRADRLHRRSGGAAARAVRQRRLPSLTRAGRPCTRRS